MKSLYAKYQQRQQKEEAERLGRDLIIKRWKECCRDIDIGLIYVLHFKFRWGKDRIKSFYKQWLWVSQQMMEQWRVDGDNTHYWVMEHRLKEDGIDYKEFDEIQAEFEDEFEINKET